MDAGDATGGNGQRAGGAAPSANNGWVEVDTEASGGPIGAGGSLPRLPPGQPVVASAKTLVGMAGPVSEKVSTNPSGQPVFGGEQSDALMATMPGAMAGPGASTDVDVVLPPSDAPQRLDSSEVVDVGGPGAGPRTLPMERLATGSGGQGAAAPDGLSTADTDRYSEGGLFRSRSGEAGLATLPPEGLAALPEDVRAAFAPTPSEGAIATMNTPEDFAREPSFGVGSPAAPEAAGSVPAAHAGPHVTPSAPPMDADLVGESFQDTTINVRQASVPQPEGDGATSLVLVALWVVAIASAVAAVTLLLFR